MARPGFEAALTRAWQRRGPLACLLWPLSLLFSALAALRRALYRSGLLASSRMPVPVIVVGNVFVGGTGKTPFTIWLVQQLCAAGHRPGVISRGHGGSGDAPRSVGAASAPGEVGDEPVLIARRTGCPLVVGRDRVAAARQLLAAHPDVSLIVSDDGLQHYRLRRDVEIVLCDQRGNGNGWMLPAGPLREPAARRRDFTVVNGAKAPPGVPPGFHMLLEGERAERLSDSAQSVALRDIPRTSRIVAAAGIGHPARFFAMLREAGLAIEELPLPDHFDFAVNPFAQVAADMILITEKDAVKCRQLDTIKDDVRVWVVPVAARIDAALTQRILEKCRGRPTA